MSSRISNAVSKIKTPMITIDQGRNLKTANGVLLKLQPKRQRDNSHQQERRVCQIGCIRITQTK